MFSFGMDIFCQDRKSSQLLTRLKFFVGQKFQLDDPLVLDDNASPDAVAVMTVAVQGELVMKQHAAVEKQVDVTRQSHESETMKMPECSHIERRLSCVECREPAEYFALNRLGRHEHGFQEVPMTYQNFEVTASDLDLERFVSFPVPKQSFNPAVQPTLTDELFEHSVEETVEVGLLMRKPEVSVIARDAVDSNLSAGAERSDHRIQEHLSTFVDLFEPYEFKLVSLIQVNAFSVHYVAEEVYPDNLRVSIGSDPYYLFRDSFNRCNCSLVIPTCCPTTEMEIRNEHY